MKRLPRILMGLSIIALLSLFKLPLWRITLVAPQYPAGVNMYIWINKIGGQDPGTLQNINILNHYVGMKKIEPDSIPELHYFPYIILGLALLGLVALILNKPWAYLSWTLLVIVLAAVGIYDFYLWEYDYGHNLSTTAPIKVPGATYQPPLFGKKTILNFTAYSFPHSGGILAGFSILFAFLAFWLKRNQR